MTIYVDPPYAAYYKNKLFDSNDSVLNRDDILAPFVRLLTDCNERSLCIKTADYLHESAEKNEACDYYSFGLLDNLEKIACKKNVRLKAFVIFEPPLVAPKLYKNLAKLTRLFEAVYVHNVIGDAYSLDGVDTRRLKKLYWPQPYSQVIDIYWNKVDRKRRVVVINGNHKPNTYNRELYSKRIEVMMQLASFDFVDLYGRGWSDWLSRKSLWLPYWRNRGKLLSIYHGVCPSKHEVLSQYDFCLCFENMQMKGYVTEKIFDCLYAGTVPIYLGADDIGDLLPSEVFIDFRRFKTISELKKHLVSLSQPEINAYKLAGRAFLQSVQGLKYYNFMNEIIMLQHRS